MESDCGCATRALRMLARVEELTTTSKIPLETALQVTEEAESYSLAVLNCELCRQQCLPLTAVTVLCAHLLDWLHQSWILDDEAEIEVHRAADDTNTTTPDIRKRSVEREVPSLQPQKFSLGGYDLDPDEADALSHELIRLRLTRFSAVLGSLEAALVPTEPSYLSSSPGESTRCNARSAPTAPACLDLVRSNLCLLRVCIRRLKERSLLNSGNTNTANVDTCNYYMSN